MASDNRPNKDKRRRQNLARRAAREARSAHAGEATSVGESGHEVAPVTSSRAKDRPAPSSSTTDGKPSAQDRRAAAKARMEARYPIPGQRAMFMGLAFAAVFAVMVLFVDHPVPDSVQPDDPRVETARDVELDDDDEPKLNDDGTVNIIEYYKVYDENARGPVGAGLIALAPLAICGAAYYYKDNKKRRNVLWTGAMFLLTGVMVLGTPYTIYMLPTLVAVGVGVFQYRKAENAPRMEELRRQREARRAAQRGETVAADDGDHQIIEGDIVEDHDSDADRDGGAEPDDLTADAADDEAGDRAEDD